MVSPASPHWSPISCVLPSPGRSAAGLVPCPSTLRFSFPLPFQGLPAPGQVCRVGVLSFFCVPLFAFWLSNSSLHLHGHLTFTPLSSSSSPHLPRHHPAKDRVCVWHICTDVKLLLLYIYIYISISGGSPGSRGGRWPMKTPPRDPCKRTRRTSVVHLGAFKSHLVATVVLYIYINAFILI